MQRKPLYDIHGEQLVDGRPVLTSLGEGEVYWDIERQSWCVNLGPDKHPLTDLTQENIERFSIKMMPEETEGKP